MLVSRRSSFRNRQRRRNSCHRDSICRGHCVMALRGSHARRSHRRPISRGDGGADDLFRPGASVLCDCDLVFRRSPLPSTGIGHADIRQPRGRPYDDRPLCPVDRRTAVVAYGADSRLQVGLALAALCGRVFCLGCAYRHNDGARRLEPVGRRGRRARPPGACFWGNFVPVRRRWTVTGMDGIAECVAVWICFHTSDRQRAFGADVLLEPRQPTARNQ